MNLNIQFGHGTHNGIQRDHNEDTYATVAESSLWLVADGMGGHLHGEVASALARDIIVEQVNQGNNLETAIHQANEAIIEKTQKAHSDDNLPMGTTIVAAQAKDHTLNLSWVGDSRIYQFKSGQLSQLSRDHSYVNELLSQGAITPEQARNHPHRNVITQALGVTPTAELKIESQSLLIESDLQILLCSDGLSEELDDQNIARILSEPLPLQETVDHLIMAALNAGGSDNVTAVLIDFKL